MTFYKGRPKFASASEAGARLGFRSGLEKQNAEHMTKLGFAFDFEKHKVKYVVPSRVATYTPDFYVKHNGIIVETKGVFAADDRAKHILVKEQHPELDIRFVFSSATSKLYAGSPTSYAKWCEDHGFQYATKTVPIAWLNERPCKIRMAALMLALTPPDIQRWGAPLIDQEERIGA